jgi:hypothetical protein
MTERDDVVRRASAYLESRGEPQLPVLEHVSFTETGEIDCDLGCDYVAVYEHHDGWGTPPENGGRESLRPYVICDPCKQAWEHRDWDYLVDQCTVGSRVADLAYLSNDVDGYETALEDWHRRHGIDDPWDRLRSAFTHGARGSRRHCGHRGVPSGKKLPSPPCSGQMVVTAVVELLRGLVHGQRDGR